MLCYPMDQLNYLNALRAFEATARNGSYVAAAKELNVTPAAVGQQIRALEAWLGARLFTRSRSGNQRLFMTHAARAALPDLSEGFARIGSGIARLKDSRSRSILTVTTTSAFISRWLLPRIDDFRNLNSEIDLRLDVSDKISDFASHNIDIGIRYGAGMWPGLIADRLLGEEAFPVCSPMLLSKQAPLDQPEDLRHHVLIHDTTLGAAGLGFPSWSDWFTLAKVGSVDATRGIRINSSAAVLHAAVAGQGIALARSVLAADDIASGRLIRPFESPSISLPFSWYLVHRAETIRSEEASLFRDWIISQTRVQAFAS